MWVSLSICLQIRIQTQEVFTHHIWRHTLAASFQEHHPSLGPSGLWLQYDFHIIRHFCSDFLRYQVAPNFKFSGLCPGPRWVSLLRSPRPSSWWGGGSPAPPKEPHSPLSSLWAEPPKLNFPPCDFHPQNKFGLTPLVHPQVKFLATPLIPALKKRKVYTVKLNYRPKHVNIQKIHLTKKLLNIHYICSYIQKKLTGWHCCFTVLYTR